MDSGVESDAEYNVAGEYCAIDPAAKRVKRSLGEMEQEFLSALTSYYYEGKVRLGGEGGRPGCACLYHAAE